MICLAVLFLVVLFVAKTTNLFKNKEIYQKTNTDGLTYESTTLENLVNKDGDGDGILDWEENLYGLDPTKKETTPGTKDSVAISRLRNKEEGSATEIKKADITTEENLSETDKFSRELFATIAATSQNGGMDDATIEQLSASLADHIQNTPPRKVFLIFDVKISNDDTVTTFRNYNNALAAIYKKYPGENYTILDVLQKFIIDENNVDASALIKLDPIIKQTKNIIDALVKTTVPQSLSTLHLSVINSLERLMENLIDIKLYDKDAIVALGGISKYQENSDAMEKDLTNLANAINQKLKN